MSAKLAHQLREISVVTFRACHCRDYSRVDIRVDHAGRPHMLGINSMAALGAGASYVLAAKKAGYSFPRPVNRTLDVARYRSFDRAPEDAQGEV